MTGDKSEGCDPLDNEISISVELTDSGLKGKAKTRAVAAVDRLLGNVVDIPNVMIERWLAPARAKIAAETLIIDAARDQVLNRIGSDPKFAQQAIENHLVGVLRKQRNKKAVVHLAVEDLRMKPPSEFEGSDSPDHLSEDFFGRIEAQAERASTEELQRKWAAVLAAEIREPETFSPAALRIVDEIEPDIAQNFNSFARDRIRNVVPYCLSNASKQQLADFANAGLIEYSAGFADGVDFLKASDTTGTSVHWFGSADGAFGFQYEVLLRTDNEALKGIQLHLDPGTKTVSFSVYMFTRAGKAISKLAGDFDRENTARFAMRLRDAVGYDHVQTYDTHSSKLVPADLSAGVRKLDVWPPKPPLTLS